MCMFFNKAYLQIPPLCSCEPNLNQVIEIPPFYFRSRTPPPHTHIKRSNETRKLARQMSNLIFTLNNLHFSALSDAMCSCKNASMYNSHFDHKTLPFPKKYRVCNIMGIWTFYPRCVENASFQWRYLYTCYYRFLNWPSSLVQNPPCYFKLKCN